MIDLHCHLLPGIDDGSKSLEQSLDMLRHAVDAGIKKIVCTPHITPGRYDNSYDSIETVFETLKAEAIDNSISIEIGFAAEIRFDPVIVDMVNNDTLPVLGEYEGERLILLEFPHSHIPPGSEELIQWLADKGIRVLIAHPERNRSVLYDIEKLRSLHKLGCLFQITGGSLTNVFSDGSRDCAIELLKRDWVSVIASDAHNLHARPPELELARQEAEKIVGEEESIEMVLGRPDKISKMHFEKNQD
jgi:protein-tyrosine phosphatase